ncbi:hypothetical protein HPB51_013524 [Rhipicephalus microplus]|uniref:SAP domain-containing protein n=1 Tax=Rhipicephalus microplus TaxID=6941 RepID=A0A9J6ETH3_RHIMP|nr:hypothetical protein HPB51_013524 [Rhipicephalus microplus]
MSGNHCELKYAMYHRVGIRDSVFYRLLIHPEGLVFEYEECIERSTEDPSSGKVHPVHNRVPGRGTPFPFNRRVSGGRIRTTYLPFPRQAPCSLGHDHGERQRSKDIADMAQPTGCESTELHAEEETTPREGVTPRRTLSRDSETTIFESVFTTFDHSTMAIATKKQLVDELRPGGLRCSGGKDELTARIIRGNITRQALEPTDSSTKDQVAYDDDKQAHLETLSADNARLCAELSSLRAQLNPATTSERETLHEAHQNASLPTERVTTPTLGLHHSVPADITMSSGSTRPPSLNDGTNQDAARPAAPTVSTNEGEPSMAQILAALVNTQALVANTLSRGPPTTSPIQIHSTSDT